MKNGMFKRALLLSLFVGLFAACEKNSDIASPAEIEAASEGIKVAGESIATDASAIAKLHDSFKPLAPKHLKFAEAYKKFESVDFKAPVTVDQSKAFHDARALEAELTAAMAKLDISDLSKVFANMESIVAKFKADHAKAVSSNANVQAELAKLEQQLADAKAHKDAMESAKNVLFQAKKKLAADVEGAKDDFNRINLGDEAKRLTDMQAELEKAVSLGDILKHYKGADKAAFDAKKTTVDFETIVKDLSDIFDETSPSSLKRRATNQKDLVKAQLDLLEIEIKRDASADPAKIQKVGKDLDDHLYGTTKFEILATRVSLDKVEAQKKKATDMLKGYFYNGKNYPLEDTLVEVARIIDETIMDSYVGAGFDMQMEFDKLAYFLNVDKIKNVKTAISNEETRLRTKAAGDIKAKMDLVKTAIEATKFKDDFNGFESSVKTLNSWDSVKTLRKNVESFDDQADPTAAAERSAVKRAINDETEQVLTDLKAFAKSGLLKSVNDAVTAVKSAAADAAFFPADDNGPVKLLIKAFLSVDFGKYLKSAVEGEGPKTYTAVENAADLKYEVTSGFDYRSLSELSKINVDTPLLASTELKDLETWYGRLNTKFQLALITNPNTFESAIKKPFEKLRDGFAVALPTRISDAVNPNHTKANVELLLRRFNLLFRYPLEELLKFDYTVKSTEPNAWKKPENSKRIIELIGMITQEDVDKFAGFKETAGDRAKDEDPSLPEREEFILIDRVNYGDDINYKGISGLTTGSKDPDFKGDIETALKKLKSYLDKF